MTTCLVKECDVEPFSRGLCKPDYMRWRVGRLDIEPLPSKKVKGRTCSVEGCERPHDCHDLCNTHYKYSVGTGKRRTGERKPTLNSYGYRLIWKPGHPNARKDGYITEHTFVMSESLGRPMLPGENVHHRNGVKTDNRLTNLELWTTHQCRGARVSDLVAWAKEILDTYPD